jgi:Cu-processing system ATP-binding protein
MPQIARFPDNLRARDVIDMIIALRAGTPADTSLINSLGLGDELNKPLGTLSGGTRQKVNAVVAFLFRPTLLILDEPTAGLDPVSSRVLKAHIRAARDRGASVIITSHILSELEELADDVAYLCDGTLQFAGTIGELLARTSHSRLEPAIAALMETQVPPPSTRLTDTGAVLSLVAGEKRA